MTAKNSISTAKRIVLMATASLFVIWIILHYSHLTSTQNGTIRFFLTMLFSLIIILRPKTSGNQLPKKIEKLTKNEIATKESEIAIFTGILGAVLMVLGLIFDVNQFEWLGFLALVFSTIKWSLPRKYHRDIYLAMFLLYWAHPLPGRVFGNFQIWMQEISVNGSEWLLHLFNVHVWADQMVLLTEQTICEVPEWCSGMRTATTVALLAAGLGLIKRLKLYQLIIFISAAIAQAIILNIIRISLIVVLTPKLSGFTSADGLHNSMSIVVIAGVFLVYGELSLFQKYKSKKASSKKQTDHIHDKIITVHPPFWKRVQAHHRLVTIIIIIAILLSAAIYKNRKYHRVEVIGKLTKVLIKDGRYTEAEKTIKIVQDYWPDNEEWEFSNISILLALQKYNEVLTLLDKMPQSNLYREIQKKILRAYSLMGLKKLDKATDIIAELPPRTRETDPRAAMILAEMAFHRNEPDKVAKHIVIASKWLPNTTRIRMLYPYLRDHHKWSAISDSDLKTAHPNVSSALSATEAYMNLNDSSSVAVMTLQSIRDWPQDTRVLEPLFFLSIKHTQPKWENLFVEQLIRSINHTDNPDIIYPIFEKCFQLSRPDIAWFLYQRIKKIDPKHPILPLTIAKYGNRWFRFRKRFLNFPAANTTDTIDITPYILTGNCMLFFQPYLNTIPLINEFCRNPVIDIRKQQLQESLQRFAEYKKAGKLSLPLHYQYIDALEINKDFEQIKIELANIAETHPEQEDNVLLKLSELYEQRNNWQDVYETIREYAQKDNAALTAMLRLSTAERNLKLGIQAIQTAKNTVAKYPDSTKAATMLANTLMEFSSAEEALYILNKPRKWHNRDLDILTAKVMQKTQRFQKAKKICEAAMYPTLPIKNGTIQYFFAKPAEFSILWRQISLPSPKDFEKNANHIRANIDAATSPFLKKLFAIWLKYYTEDDNKNSITLKNWIEIGRSNTEKATALKQYALLLANNKKHKKALEAVQKALEFMPQSALLWNMAISLSNADTSIISHARQACPNNDNIWLAELVTRTRPSKKSPNTAKTIANQEKDIIKQLSIITKSIHPIYSAAAMTRASEYLFRIGMNTAAAMAAHNASNNAQSYLPAHIMAIKCALKEDNKKWALKATKRAIDSALNPPPLLFKELVKLKIEDNKLATDSEMIEALSNLRRADQNNIRWAEMLGFIRFQRGNWEVMDALQEMTFAIQNGSRSKLAFIIAAESSRLLNNLDQSIYLLRQGLNLFPNDITLRNNLAFVLAHTKDGIKEAITIIEELIRENPDNEQILDSAIVIYIKSNQLDKAKDMIKDILNKTKENSEIYFRTKTNQADIYIRESNLTAAKTILEKIINTSANIPKLDLIKASDLLNKVRTIQYRKKQAAKNALEKENSPVKKN